MEVVQVVQKCMEGSSKRVQHFAVAFLDGEVDKMHTDTLQEVLEADLCYQKNTSSSDQSTDTPR